MFDYRPLFFPPRGGWLVPRSKNSILQCTARHTTKKKSFPELCFRRQNLQCFHPEPRETLPSVCRDRQEALKGLWKSGGPTNLMSKGVTRCIPERIEERESCVVIWYMNAVLANAVCPARHLTDVSDSLSVPSHPLLPHPPPPVYYTSPTPLPCTVIDAVPVPARFVQRVTFTPPNPHL